MPQPVQAPRPAPAMASWTIGLLWLFAATAVAFGSMAWLEGSAFDATQRKLFLAVCVVVGGGIVVVSGLLSRALIWACAGAALGALIGAMGHYAISANAAARRADAEARELQAYRRVMGAASGDADIQAVADAWRQATPVPVPRLVCKAALAGDVPIATLMRVAEGLVAAGDAAGPIESRRRALLLVLAEIEMRHETASALPAWLGAWRSQEPPGTTSVEAEFPVTSDPGDECAGIGNAFTVAQVLNDGGLPAAAAWHRAGFALTPWQQHAVLAPLHTVADVDAALSGTEPRLDVNATGQGYLVTGRTTALMEQAYGAGLRLQGAPEDAEVVDVLEAFLRHGADPALRDDQGRDACALFEEALASPGAPPAQDADGQIARGRALLCRAGSPMG